MTTKFLALRFGMAVAFALSASLAVAQTKTIKLGASVQLSGSLANTGRYYRDAYNLAVSTINDKGGVPSAVQRVQARSSSSSTTSRTSI